MSECTDDRRGATSEQLEELDALLGRSRPDELAAPGAEARVARITAAVPSPPLLLRAVLAVVALIQVPITVGWLFNTDPFGILGGAPSDAHLVRDGAFGVVILAAAFMAVWRPRWANPCFVIALIAMAAHLAAGFVDHHDTWPQWNEAVHLLFLLTTLLIAALGLRLRPLGPSRRRPRLRSVETEPKTKA